MTKSSRSSAVPFLRAAALAAGLLSPSFAVVAAAQGLSPSAVQQMQAISDEKASRSPEQQKIDSQLLQAHRESKGQPAQPGASAVRSTAEVDNSGATLVDIDATVTDAVLKRIADDGGSVVSSFPQYDAIRAWMPLDKLEDLAGMPEVRFIRPADKSALDKINTSEGDITHRANLARSNFGVNGSGITVGVLSNSVDSLASLQGSGDLPPACPATPCSKFLPGQSGVPGTSEGTAMMEIVFDLAPGANIFFATANPSQAQFATNILALQTAGAQVIVDDAFYFLEPVFQDGIIAQAVNSVVGGGVSYFSSAGNAGSKLKGTSGTWEGDFNPIAATVPGVGSVVAHDFGGGVAYDVISGQPPFGVIVLQWSDAFGASANDYDLYLLNSAGTTVLAASTNVQNGTQNPIEGFTGAFGVVGDRLVIVQNPGAANRFLHLDTFRGKLNVNTTGATHGHSGGAHTISVAAVGVATAGCPSCVGFSGGAQNPVENFSSDGPRRIFYNPDGTAITPGNFLSTGGQLLSKPDIAAADGVMCATPGFNPFFGTSAAAPHAAAIAALMRSRNPNLNSGLALDRLKEVLGSTARDIEAPGLDINSGKGVLDANAAVRVSGTGIGGR